ncbi:MAG: PAS domain S-box protein, partial [Candidatus Hydrogenedentota bacterium]
MEPSVRLLCVDNSSSGLIPVQQALEYASFPVEIVPAFTPEELAQRLSDAAYEAVIADVNAPWVDVDTMLDQIGKRLPGAPVIIVADPGLEGPITEALKKGASDYIPKHPPDIHRLPKNLETLLELQRLKREKGELSTIRAVRDLIDRSAQASIDELLREIAKTLPAGFRWPEKMAVQIRFGERTAESAGFVDKKPAFCKEFVTADGEEHGHVKAVWLEPPPMGGPPFLPEEEQLLDHVSRTLGAHLSRRVAEARYAAERQLTAHMMNNLPGWVFLVSRDGYYVGLNRRFAEATGYTNGELWGMDYTELVAPLDKEAVVRAFHTVFDEGYTEVEARITKKNGETIPYLFVVSRVTLEDEPYLLGVGVDISERRKAEEDNRLLRSAVENATEAIILTEGRTEAPGPRIVYANNAFLQMTGYTHDEVVGRVPWFLMGPKTDMHVIRELRDHLREGREFSGETTNYRKDRTEFVSEWSVAPVRDLSGAITHFVAILRDVTERRRLEVQLWSSMRLESIGRLAGGVAHDFNNLLAIIMGYSELVACSLPEDSPIAG